jgi:uncharacterized membrane protein
LAAAIQTIYYNSALPAKVASHFNIAGTADGFADRSSLLILYWIVIGLAFVVSHGVPLLIDRMPVSMINLPNKEYWLSEERRAGTLGFIRGHCKWLGVLLLVLFIVLFQMIFGANMSTPPRLGNSIWVVIVGFVVLIGFWGVTFNAKFRRVD